ncbi:MAG: hypothetical protein EXQ91_00270 [Alphaproteobacteria bacterium]|nr:hypothetical protein [Alphaproteobacteria bacterium]
MLTIVVYHYVRPLAETRYPALAGLDLARFEGQLDYIARHYEVVSLADLVRVSFDTTQLPHNACVLTFDDGLADHYTYCLPALIQRKMSGAFFVSSDAALGRGPLDVQLVQHILAACPDVQVLTAEIAALYESLPERASLPNFGALHAQWAKPGRYDPAEVIFLKRLFQVALPAASVRWLLDRLIGPKLGTDRATFAREVYVSLAQLRVMARMGMEIGGHGASHRRVTGISSDELRLEVKGPWSLLDEIGIRPDEPRFFTYPHGAVDETAILAVKKAGYAGALTGERALVKGIVARYLLPRLDTNDLPQTAEASPNEFTIALRAEAS